MQQIIPKIYAEISPVAEKFIKSPSKVKLKTIPDKVNSYPYIYAGTNFESTATTDIALKAAKAADEGAKAQNAPKLNTVSEQLGQNLHYFG